MSWKNIANKLFPKGYDIKEENNILFGTALVQEETVSIIGTSNHTTIGFDIATSIAGLILKIISENPMRSIIILIDTEGQKLRKFDEILGINSVMAHVAKCIDIARKKGHKIIGVIYQQACSGGFITTGLMADACYALPEAEIRAMGLLPMSKITKIPLDKLTELSKSNPIFSPDPEIFLKMGGISAIWKDNFDQKLIEALKEDHDNDIKSQLGFERKVRLLSFRVIEDILNS